MSAPPLPPPPGAPAADRAPPPGPYRKQSGQVARSAAAAFGDSDSEEETPEMAVAKKLAREEKQKRRRREAYDHCQAATNPSLMYSTPAEGAMIEPAAAKAAAMAQAAQATVARISMVPPSLPPPPAATPPATSSATHSSQQPKPPQPLQSPQVQPVKASGTNFAAAVALAKAKAAAIAAKLGTVQSSTVEPRVLAQPPATNYPTAKTFSYPTASEITAADIENKLNPKIKYEYDSDEDTEGGTWEHKKRAMEMQKTADEAAKLTDMNAQKHHIADFLPKEEHEKFMEKFHALREGRKPELDDYRSHKIQSDNIGYKMLQKEGWSKGSGLGPTEQGITAPINKGSTTSGAGVGATKPDDVTAQDDLYSLYRKRNMLAYKFRPNPLNNPRRPY